MGIKVLKLNFLDSFFIMKVSVILVIGIGFLIKATPAQAQDLFVNPKRVVFEGQKRIQEVNVANIGRDSSRYIISFIQIRMKADGSFEEITQPDSGQNFSDKFLRVFPRTIVLPPNEAQVVKIQLTNSARLLPGEYRSHLYFRAVPKAAPLGEKSPEVKNGVSVQLTPVFGISIPIIIRSGETTARVQLSDLRLVPDNGSPALELRIKRTGNKSIYGNISIEHVSNKGKVTEVSSIKGLAVYTPNQFRVLKIKLKNSSGIDYGNGILQVKYIDAETEKNEVLATEQLVLN